MIKNPNHSNGRCQTAAKLILAFLFSFVVTTLLAQEASTPLLERLNGTTWMWSPTNVGGITTTTVTFKGTTLEYSWGGSGALSTTADPLTISLKTADGIVLDMIFDPFTSGFEVKNGPRLIARGRKPKEPTATSAPAAAAVVSDKQIKLKTGFDTPMQGGAKTLADLAQVLNGFGKADANPPFIDMEMFSGVRYLMPLNEAVAALGLSQRLPAAKKVVCPGLPKDCFNYISFDGVFDGHFNRLDLVVDGANQVVSIQLTDEHPKDTSTSYSGEGEWLTFNFIGYRVKAMNYMKVQYKTSDLRPRRVYSNGKVQQSVKWDTPYEMPGNTPGICRKVNAYLRNKEHKVLEETEWFVPKPLADLIMQCISKAQR